MIDRWICGVVGGLLGFSVLLQAAEEGKPASYRDVAVFPLPDAPPNKLEPLIGVVRELVPTGSRFEDAQLTLWLQQLPAADLEALLAD